MENMTKKEILELKSLKVLFSVSVKSVAEGKSGGGIHVTIPLAKNKDFYALRSFLTIDSIERITFRSKYEITQKQRPLYKGSFIQALSNYDSSILDFLMVGEVRIVINDIARIVTIQQYAKLLLEIMIRQSLLLLSTDKEFTISINIDKQT